MRLNLPTRRTIGTAGFAACAVLVVGSYAGERRAPTTGQALRFALLDAVSGDADRAGETQRAGTFGRRSVTNFPVGTRAVAATAKVPSPPTFGQPTIAGVAGWGFEADLRLDPIEREPPLHELARLGGSDTSWIWRSLDGGKTFKWVPAAAPLERQGDDLPRRRRHRARGRSARAASTSTTSRSPTSASPARTTTAARSRPATRPASPTRASIGSGTRSTATRRRAARSTSTNDEVGNGNVQCGNDAGEQRARHVPLAGRRRGRDGRAAVRPAEPDHAAGLVRRGDHGQRRGQPGRDADRAVVSGTRRRSRRAVRHVYVIHDDGSLSKILIARCFPVAFGAPVTNVSDPSGLNCVDLPVANLGDRRRPDRRQLPVARDRPRRQPLRGLGAGAV